MKTLPFLIASLLALPFASLPAKEAARTGTPETIVTIAGQVRRPGPVQLRKDLTIFAAVYAGGGPTEFGAMRRVKLLRNGKTETIDLTKDESKQLKVQPEDVIEVPQKNIIGR